MLDWSRFGLLLKARQIGASHVYAAAVVLWAMLGETSTIISLGADESAEVLLKAKQHAEVLKRLGSRLTRLVASSHDRISFSSRGRVISLPRTSGGRSYSGNVILDEFAYPGSATPEQVWDGAAGTITHGYRMRVLSTPNGVGNLFHQLWEHADAKVNFTRHQVTIDDAIAQGLRVNWDDLWTQAHGDQRIFDQLFRCQFLDADQQYIPTALINAALEDETVIFNGDAFGGLDIGRTNDATSLYVVRVDGDGVLWVQSSYESKRIPVGEEAHTTSDDLDAIVDKAFTEWQMRRLCVDSSGIGAFPAQRMQQAHGRHRVEPVVFTQNSKEDLATTLFQVLTEKRLKIPREDKALQRDLASIKRIITTAGNVRYDAPRTAEGHGDRAWALALAVHAATQPAGRKHVQPSR